MNIKVHLLGALVDYLPDSDRGQTVLSLEDGVSIAGLLEQLGIMRRVEVAVNDEYVDAVVEAITGGAKSGSIGDGKIFVLDLADCIRIRTGETGIVAIG